MLVYRKNIISGKVNIMSLPVTQKQLDIYENTNVNVQDIFPDLDADQREFLISGFMPGEFEHHVDGFEAWGVGEPPQYLAFRVALVREFAEGNQHGGLEVEDLDTMFRLFSAHAMC